MEEMATLEGWTGDGSESAPFVIEDYEIAVTGSGASGIEVWNTTAFLTVRNCTIQGDWNADSGILFANATNATAIENNCHSFGYGGICLAWSSGCVVTNNTCTSNFCGIYLQESDSNNVTDNNVSSNDRGIYATGSSNNSFENNTCCNCDYGFYFRANYGKVCSNNTLSGNNCSSCSFIGIHITRDCDNNTIDRCICDENPVGIWILGSPSTFISNNTCSRNDVGILLYDSSHSTVCENLLSCNVDYGVKVDVCYYNLIFNNTFIDNNGAGDEYDPEHIQAMDDGGLNQWNVSGYGNYWSDWIGPDENLDGIVDCPYDISTLPLARDYYPRTTQSVPIPEFSSSIIPVIVMTFMVIAMLAYRRRK